MLLISLGVIQSSMGNSKVQATLQSSMHSLGELGFSAKIFAVFLVLLNKDIQWIGLSKNPQETREFPMKHGGSENFSSNPLRHLETSIVIL